MSFEPRIADPPSTIWNEFWEALKANRLVILCTFLCTVIAVIGALQFSTDIYEANARILVKIGRENSEVPASVDKGGVISTGVRKEEINSNVLLLNSRELIEQTLDEIGLDAFRVEPPPPRTFVQRVKHQIRNGLKFVSERVQNALIALKIIPELTFREKTLLALEHALDAERERDSDVILVTLRLPSPEIAVRFLDRLLVRFHDRHIEVHKDTASSQFFHRQSESYKSKLDSFEQAKQQIRREYALTSINEERAKLLTRLHALHTENEQDVRERALLPKSPGEGKVAEARGEAGVSNPSINLLRDRITQLRMNRVELYGIYPSNSPQIADANEEIDTLEIVLFRALDRRIAERQKQIDDIQARLTAINTGEDKLSEIEREREIAGQNYASYINRWEDARVSEEMDRRRVANIAILSAPQMPIRPVAPRKLLIAVMSIPAGLILGIGLALFFEYTNDRIRHPRDLARLSDVPLLGSFKLSAAGARRFSRKPPGSKALTRGA